MAQGWKETLQGIVPKVRCIDNFTVSLINSAVQHSEKASPDTLDTLVALVRETANGQRVKIRWRKDDFKHAFKTLPICSGHLPLAVTVWPEIAQHGEAFQLLSLPFGASASVSGWDRFGLAVQGILARIFLLLYFRFVDDMFAGDAEVEPASCPEPCFVGPDGAAHLARVVVQDLLGWSLDAAKATTAEKHAVILGVGVRFDDANQVIAFELERDRLQQWRAQILEALEDGALAPTQAQKLAGKLSWGATAVFGRGARVHLAAVYRHGAGHQRKLSQRTRLCLQWWVRFLEAPPARCVPVQCPERTRCILYTDATGQGRMAWVIQSPYLKAWSASVVPAAAREWARYRKNQVGTWELMAAVCGLKFLISTAPGDLEIVAFVDNTSALGAILRGCSRQTDWNDLIGDLWLAAAQRGHFLHAWYVPSHLNLADAPTRPETKASEIAELASRGFREIQWVFPPGAPWSE